MVSRTPHVRFDGKTPISVSTVLEAVKDRPAWLNLILQVGPARYAPILMTDTDSKPQIEIKKFANLDKEFLFLLVPQNTACDAYMFVYKDKRIVLLQKWNSNKLCRQPTISGEIVETHTWTSFWTKNEKYKLSADGNKLEKVPQEFYSMLEESGTRPTASAKKDFRLDRRETAETCPSSNVKSYEYVSFEKYQESTKSYFIKAASGSCGWIVESELDKRLENLPYAG